MPVMFYDIHSKGAESYIQLAKEVITNAQKRLGQRAKSIDTGTRADFSAASAGGGSDSPGTTTH
jgi:hypothetical protein